MPEMNGFKFVGIIALEMDIPIAILSIDSNTDSIIRGLVHGACDYIIKPKPMEVFRNIWQHVLECKGLIHEEFTRILNALCDIGETSAQGIDSTPIMISEKHQCKS